MKQQTQNIAGLIPEPLNDRLEQQKQGKQKPLQELTLPEQLQQLQKGKQPCLPGSIEQNITAPNTGIEVGAC